MIEARPHNEQDPVYKFFNNLFNKANRFNYEDFNYIHKKLTSQKEIILKEAVDHLLKSGQTIKIDTSFGNDKGFIKYLKKIFFDNQLLRKENGVGSEIICTIEKNYSKYINHFPALCDMIKEIESYQKINIKGFINKYKLSPYGLGNISLQLYLSFIIKYFGDELAYKRDPLNPGEIIISSSEQIKELISSSSPDAVFEKRVLDDIQKDLLVKLYQVFSNTPLGANEIPTIKTVIELTQQWFNNLPKISKSVDFYKERLYKEFIKMFELLDGAQGYLFIFHKLQTLWDYDSEDRLTNEIKDKIIEGIRTIKEQLYKTQENIENNIFQKYLELFEVKGTTYTNLEESINNWYNELDNIQKNINSTEHSKNSIPLIKYLKETNNIKQIIMESIPACSDYNLGKISEWNTDNTEIYINKIKDGIKKIDLMRIKVLPPIINIKGELKKREIGKEINIEYQDKNSLEVKISIPDKVKEVWVTYDENVISIENSQKEIITSGEKLIIPDKILQKIRVVSVDKERNFSEERIIILEEKIKGVVSNIYGYSVEKPSSEKEIKTLLNGLIKNFINNDKIKKDEIINQLKEIIKDLENGC